jgi:hypothetical protein
MSDIGYHAIGRSANWQNSRHTGDWAQNVIDYSNVRQHYLTRVGNGDPIAEGGTVGAYPHAGGEFLSVQVIIERFASRRSVANDLFVNLNPRRAKHRAGSGSRSRHETRGIAGIRAESSQGVRKTAFTSYGDGYAAAKIRAGTNGKQRKSGDNIAAARQGMVITNGNICKGNVTSITNGSAEAENPALQTVGPGTKLGYGDTRRYDIRTGGAAGRCHRLSGNIYPLH